MRTLLIDSEQLESDDALDADFRDAASVEIEQFKREIIQRDGAQRRRSYGQRPVARGDEYRRQIRPAGRTDPLRRLGLDADRGLGHQHRHPRAGRAGFRHAVLCEQVVGRALRRQSYDLNEEGMFNPEYADILGIPFDFTAKPVVVKPAKPPRPSRAAPCGEREALEITFPRVAGYRVELPNERHLRHVRADSVAELTPELVGPAPCCWKGSSAKGSRWM